MTNPMIIQKHFEAIEKVRTKVRRLEKGYQISFCPKQRQRIAWDHCKAQLELKRLQRDYVKLCDVMMSSGELERFLLLQNIKVHE